jgi:DNA-binding transcriptional LysR family regulator
MVELVWAGMTLEQIRIFVAVAVRQHLTEAAKALNLSPSAVSSAIAALEGRYKVPLFDRVGRNIVLNPAGEAFLAQATQVMASMEAARTTLADLSGLERGRLGIQASQTIASYWLPPRLARFHEAHPGIALDVSFGNTEQVSRAVAEGLAELGFVEGEVDDPVLSRAVIGREHLSLVVSPSHPWAARPEIVPDLASAGWILREAGSGTRAAFESWLVARKASLANLKIVMVLPGNEAVRSAIEAGAGAGVMSRSVARLGVTRGALVEIAAELPVRDFYVLRHKQRYRSRAGQAFMDLAGAHIDAEDR